MAPNINLHKYEHLGCSNRSLNQWSISMAPWSPKLQNT